MKLKIIVGFIMFLSTIFNRTWGGTVDPQARLEADQYVQQMRGFSMQENPGPTRSDGTIEPKEQRKEEIVKNLRRLGEDAIPALIDALRDPDVQMRRNAELVLIQLSGSWESKPVVDIRAAIPALIKATEDQDPDVRAWAAHALGDVGPDAKQAVPALIRLVKDPFEGARNDSCMALGDIGPAAKKALPVLHSALSDPSKDVRKFAQRAIERIEGNTVESTSK